MLVLLNVSVLDFSVGGVVLDQELFFHFFQFHQVQRLKRDQFGLAHNL